MNGITQTLNIGNQSTGAGAGKVTFQPLTIAKYPDDCSPDLFMLAASGTPFEHMIVVVEVAGKGKRYVPLYMMDLDLAAIQSLTDSASDRSRVLETVAVEYGALTICKFNQSSDGSLATGPCSGWNRVKNVPWNNSAILEGIASNWNKTGAIAITTGGLVLQ